MQVTAIIETAEITAVKNTPPLNLFNPIKTGRQHVILDNQRHE